MKILKLLPIIVLLSGCAPMQNEVWIKKDGSVKSVQSYEVGEAISGFIDIMDQNKGKGSSNGSEGENFQFDTMMRVSEQMPPSFRSELLYPEFWDSLSVHMHGSSPEEIRLDLSAVYDPDFDSDQYLVHWREKAKNDPTLDTTVIKMYAHQYVYNQDQNIITLPQFDLISFLKESKELVPSSSIDTVQMIMDGEIAYEEAFGTVGLLFKVFENDITTIVHTPSEILFTNDPRATIESNKVTFVRNIQEEIKREKFTTDKDYIIKLK